MFSALKKLAKGGDERCPAPVPMSSSLQKKFSKGVHFNMKILIKGDRNVGKSCLLQRLQGGPFIEQYAPTDQIKVAPVHWTYKNTDFIVKVEVWEVVDKGRTRKKPPLGLKLDNQSVPDGDDDTPVLDASFLDVHKDANGVILMMDITKPWTFDYVVKELERIPGDLPVVILGNHCDMMHHRQVHTHHIDTALHHARQIRTAPIRYAESSMRNGFGLRFLHKFLSIPFLRLQRASLLLQLERNDRDSNLTDTELDQFQKSEEADYTIFTERLANKRRESTAGHSGQDTPPVGKSIVLGGGKPIVPPHVNPLLAQSLAPKPRTPERDNTTQGSYVSPELLKPKQHAVSMDVTPTRGGESSAPTTPTTNPSTGGALDEFYAGNLDTSFLDDLTPMPQANDVQSDSDDDRNVMNPMVTFDEDDLEEFYETTSKTTTRTNTSGTDTQKHNTGKSFIIEYKNTSAEYKNTSAEYKNTSAEYKNTSVEYKNTSAEYNNAGSDYNNKSSDYKNPSSDYKNTSSDYNNKSSDYKNTSSDYKNPSSDYKNPSSDYKNPSSDYKTPSLSQRNSTQNFENPTKDFMSSSSICDEITDRLMKSSIKSDELDDSHLGLEVDYLWTAESSVRRSPEGGEDPDLVSKESEEKSEKKHKKKKSKDKERDKNKERGDGDKERKEKKHKHKRAKDKEAKSPQQELLSPGTSAIDYEDYDSI